MTDTTNMRLHLVDRSEDLVHEWEAAFRSFPDVVIECGDILKVAHTALVSPANSFGYMNGGIDLAYRFHFGVQIEHAVQKKIKEVAGSYLPVGQAVLVQTGHDKIPYLISAPTMFLPEPIDERACLNAMSAALKVAFEYREEWEAVFCPGMGTGVGRLSPRSAARAMADAYAAAKIT
jgi:O-acetyl-ADP-ribose deacetylase (regulator of RNase III)